jgi:hypothetical protein
MIKAKFGEDKLPLRTMEVDQVVRNAARQGMCHARDQTLLAFDPFCDFSHHPSYERNVFLPHMYQSKPSAQIA